MEQNFFNDVIFNHACGLGGPWELTFSGVQTRCQQLSTKALNEVTCAVSYALPYDTRNTSAFYKEKLWNS
ncbi:hypothetical protein HDG35_006323 [Paraburkholderia sp. JPY681]|uniref:Uncharacterized protein n=1 Tax=Paraburkholderia atlantica TaxID=2654982 RepID=D5WN80_PARAM|nr:hypothetical protein BC1002_6968 [Paraburkholderia atlantica]MBB5510027.1 hypothetical protein [Paraburkholderia atlantica]